MHQLVKDLAERASRDDSDGYATTLEYSDRFAHRFANLLLNECIGILVEEVHLEMKRMMTSFNRTDEDLHANKIKHFNKLIVKSYAHFGVEE